MPATAGASIPEVSHHHTLLDDTDLHYVSAGYDGTPVLLVHGDFPHHTVSQVAEHVSAATLDGVGHYAAMETPDALAQALLDFYRTIDA